jgi:hypothetical protein
LAPKKTEIPINTQELVELEKELGQVEEKLLAALGIDKDNLIEEKMRAKLVEGTGGKPANRIEDKKKEKKRSEIDYDDSMESEASAINDSEREEDASDDVSDE